MGVEVASLTSRLTFTSSGAAEVQRDAKMMEQAIVQVQKAAASADPQIRKMGTVLGESVDKWNQGAQVIKQYSAELEAMGSSAKNFAADSARIRAEAEKEEVAIESLTAELKQLKAAERGFSSPIVKAIGNRDETTANRLKKERAETQALIAAKKQEVAAREANALAKRQEADLIDMRGLGIRGAGRGIIDAEADIARMSGAIDKKLNPAANRAGRSMGMMGRQGKTAWQMLGTSAFNGAASFASAIGRLSGLGAVAYTVVKALMKLGQAMDQVASVSHFGPLYDQFNGLASKSNEVTSQVVAQFGKIRNSLRGEGVLNADALTKGLAGLATKIEPLTGGNLEAAASIVDAVRKGNLEAASDIGFNAKRMAEDISQMGASYTEVEAEQKRVIAFQREMARNQQYITEASQNQVKSWKDLKAAGQRVFEAIGKALLPLIQPLVKFIEQVAKWIEAFAPLAPLFTGAFKAIASLLGLIGEFMERSLPMVLKGIGALHQLVPRPLQVALKALTGIDLKKWGDSATQMAKDLEGGLGDLTYKVDEATQSWERFQNEMASARGATSAIDAVYQLGEAFTNLEKDSSPKNGFATLKAFQSLFDQVMEGGIEKAGALRKVLAQPFFKEQLGDQVIEDMVKALNLSVEAMTPFQAEVDKYKRATDTAATSTQTTTGAVTTLSGQARIATTDVTNLGSALNALPARTNVDVVLNMVGGGGVVGGGLNIGGFLGKAAGLLGQTLFPTTSTLIKTTQAVGAARAKATAGTGPPGKIGREGYLPPPRGVIGMEGQQAVQAQIKKARSVEDSSTDLFDFLGGGKSGGGGGGSKPAGVDIEALRRFFDQVNKAILAGIRGGLSYSTAGNAIPLGGQGQFMSSQGGVLIESVNLRGVFDFADPAAKREIVRQLKEALRGFEQEI